MKPKVPDSSGKKRGETCIRKICGKSVKKFKKHYQYMHKIKYRAFECQECDYFESLLDKNRFLIHLSKHEVRQTLEDCNVAVPEGFKSPVLCPLCPMKYKNGKKLANHCAVEHCDNDNSSLPDIDSLSIQPPLSDGDMTILERIEHLNLEIESESRNYLSKTFSYSHSDNLQPDKTSQGSISVTVGNNGRMMQNSTRVKTIKFGEDFFRTKPLALKCVNSK